MTPTHGAPVRFRLTLMGLVLAIGSQAQAADAEKGKALSAPCVACHGTDGISPNPQWPNLAGQKDQYLISSLKAYRNGDRSNPIMSPLAKGLSDEDIENLAAYYSGL